MVVPRQMERVQLFDCKLGEWQGNVFVIWYPPKWLDPARHLLCDQQVDWIKAIDWVMLPLTIAKQDINQQVLTIHGCWLVL